MNTRIEKDFTFQAAVHFDNRFVLNIYELSLSMIVQTESIREQNIAMDRMQYFLSEVVENSIFVDQDDTKAIEHYANAGINVCMIPDQPFDQVISLVLLLKINAIMEDRMVITDAVMGSKLSDGVRFVITDEMAEKTFGDAGWWISPFPGLTKLEKNKGKKEKIVKMPNHKDWGSLGLSWKETPGLGKDTPILTLVESDREP